MSAGFKRTILALMLLVASATATSGATYTASSLNNQGFTAAADFGVHVSLADPGSVVGATVNLQANASETGGGTITTVAIERSPAGSGTWTTICTDSAPDYECAWNTSAVSDGAYDLRARATNNNGYSRYSAIVAGVVVDNSVPTVTVDAPGAWFRGTKTLTSTVTGVGPSGLASVRYEYKTSAGSTWSTACTASASPWSCSFATTSLTNGTSYDFRAVAVTGVGNEGTSPSVTDQRPDNANPSGTISAPLANLRGSVTLSGTASDTHSGVASAQMQYSPAGAGSWSAACTDTTSPFSSCSWDTTLVTDGLYDVRTVVTDVAGNTYTSAAVTNRRVDNTLPLTSLTNPGSPLSGTVTLTATGTDTGGSGVRDVTFQRSAAGAGSWSDLCVDPAFSYTCDWNTTTLPDALYDVRTVATDNAGNVSAASTVTSRRVDNYVPSAVDVQTANGGATPGVIEPGDSMTLTYSEQIDPASVIAGWDGTGAQNIYVAFSNHNGQGDRMQFHSVVNPFPELVLAAAPGVRLNADYVGNNGATFAATLSQDGPSVTITLGALLQYSVNATAPGAATMTWFPTSGCRDFVGKACSTTQRPESGAPDAEF